MTTATPTNTDDSINGFTISDLRWENYMKDRPSYPPALYQRISAYHRSHSSSREIFYEIGAGNGLASVPLLQEYRMAIVSDPNPDYIEAAKQFLPSLSHINPSLLKFAQHRAEDSYHAPPDTIDLVISAMSLHWMSSGPALHQAHSALRSGGTFAAWSYGPWASVSSPKLQTAIDDLGTAYWAALLQHIAATSGPEMEEKYWTASKIGYTGFDGVDFDPAMWMDVRRLKWHGSRPLGPRVRPEDVLPSNIRNGEMTQELGGQEPDFCAIDANSKCIVNFAGGIQKVPGFLDGEVGRNLANNVHEIMLKELGEGGKTKLCFPFVLLLATKR